MLGASMLGKSSPSLPENSFCAAIVGRLQEEDRGQLWRVWVGVVTRAEHRLKPEHESFSIGILYCFVGRARRGGQGAADSLRTKRGS